MRKSMHATATSATSNLAALREAIYLAETELPPLVASRYELIEGGAAHKGWFSASFEVWENEEGMRTLANAFGGGMPNCAPDASWPMPLEAEFFERQTAENRYEWGFSAPVLMFSPQSWGGRDYGGGFEVFDAGLTYDPNWDEWDWHVLVLRPDIMGDVPIGAYVEASSASSGSVVRAVKVGEYKWQITLLLPPKGNVKNVPYECSGHRCSSSSTRS